MTYDVCFMTDDSLNSSHTRSIPVRVWCIEVQKGSKDDAAIGSLMRSRGKSKGSK